MIRVVNKSSYPAAEVRSLVRRTLGYFDITDGVGVTVSLGKRTRSDPMGRYTSGHYRGWWYPGRGEHCPQIHISLPHPDVPPAPYEPYRRKREKGETFPLSDWREALVALTAHEGWHHRQQQRREQFREVDCDLAALRAVGYLRDDERRAA